MLAKTPDFLAFAALWP